MQKAAKVQGPRKRKAEGQEKILLAHAHGPFKIFQIFVPNLWEIYLFSKKKLFQQNLGPFSVMAAKKLI